MKALIAGFAVLLLSAAAGAILPPPPTCPRDTEILLQLCENDDAAQFRASLAAQISRYDLANDGLDTEDIALVHSRQQAKERAESIKQALAYDLDGDLAVEKSEAERAIPGLLPRDRPPAHDAARQLRNFLLAYDANRDDRVDQQEIFAAPLPQANFKLLASLRAIMAGDSNGDHRIDEFELSLFAKRMVDEADTNGDGRISLDEQKDQTVRRKAANSPLPNRYWGQLCALPPVPSDAQLLLYSGHAGTDREAGRDAPHTTEVRIEPGSQPLYLVMMSSFPRVWRFSGATERISRVLVSVNHHTPPAEADAEGVPADRLTRLPESCLRGASRESELEPAKTVIFLATGRQPDRAVATLRADMVTWPSGDVMPKPETLTAQWKPVDVCALGAEAPVPPSFGRFGAQGAYSFVIQGAPDGRLTSFLRAARKAGFSVLPLTVNMNGYDTIFAHGRSPLTDAIGVREEFRTACALRSGKRIFLSDARYNLVTEQKGGGRME